MAAQRGSPLGVEALQVLREGFNACLGQFLPQKLEHTLLIARRKADTKAKPASKKPRPGRGS